MAKGKVERGPGWDFDEIRRKLDDEIELQAFNNNTEGVNVTCSRPTSDNNESIRIHFYGTKTTMVRDIQFNEVMTSRSSSTADSCTCSDHAKRDLVVVRLLKGSSFLRKLPVLSRC
ncbi:hypothetical protein KIN20_025370 [Parelaphostrongylus tenuis]|uniref:Uncharacterized protein n=1 Tax=Parelaphostrongylus tenuis TaxID=148309 RepID=A0AAD5QUD6_PARTN|nr:hypothetical protein KIN20_025370 [Parelaphostrongylus tenuis]